MILKIHHVFKSDYHKLRVKSSFSPDSKMTFSQLFTLQKHPLHLNRAFSLNNDLIRSLSHLNFQWLPHAYRRKLKSTKLPVMFSFKGRETKRERIPAKSPSELLGESNKNVCRSTFLAFCGVTIPWRSLIKLWSFLQNINITIYLHAQRGIQFQGICGCSKTIQIKNLLRYLLSSRWYPELSAASRWHFQPHKQASGSPVGSLIIHADVQNIHQQGQWVHSEYRQKISTVVRG